MVARLSISPRIGAAEELVRAPRRRISFIEAKRRAVVVQRIMRAAIGSNVVAFPVMRRCQGGPPKGRRHDWPDRPGTRSGRACPG
jgi:hypothetical protein